MRGFDGLEVAKRARLEVVDDRIHGSRDERLVGIGRHVGDPHLAVWKEDVELPLGRPLHLGDNRSAKLGPHSYSLRLRAVGAWNRRGARTRRRRNVEFLGGFQCLDRPRFPRLFHRRRSRGLGVLRIIGVDERSRRVDRRGLKAAWLPAALSSQRLGVQHRRDREQSGTRVKDTAEQPYYAGSLARRTSDYGRERLWRQTLGCLDDCHHPIPSETWLRHEVGEEAQPSAQSVGLNDTRI